MMRHPTHNEYGTKLDSNGYAPSIMPLKSFKCYNCDKYKDTARHEIFGGPLRSKSKQYGKCLPHLPCRDSRQRAAASRVSCTCPAHCYAALRLDSARFPKTLLQELLIRAVERWPN